MEPGEPDKRVSWAELFFDLVFVFAITQVSLLLKGEHNAAGRLRALIVFVLVYWTWVGTAVQTNLRDPAQPSLRVTLFAIALASIFMAIAVPHAYRDEGLLFAAAYWAGRVMVGTLMVGRWPRGAATWLTPYTVSIVITGPLLLAGALTSAGRGRRSGRWRRRSTWRRRRCCNRDCATCATNAAHLAERFGSFVLIALGESVVAIGASAQADHRLHLAGGLAVASAFALAGGPAQHHPLALSYGNLLFIAAIVLISVGMYGAVAEPTHHLP